MDTKRSSNMDRPKQQQLVLKLLVIGDYGVGKTAIVRRYTEGNFSSNYKITIGAEFSVRVVNLDVDTVVNLQLWDIAGHERFGYMTRVYYKNAVGCAIVFDVSRFASYHSVIKWLNDLREKVVLENGTNVPVILLANKWDIGDYCICDETVNKLCRDVGFTAWFKTSAKTNLNIDEAMNCLVDGVLSTRNPNIKKPENDCITLHNDKKKESSSCCH